MNNFRTPKNVFSRILKRVLNIGLVIASLFCYLEWSDHSVFLGTAEADILFRAPSQENFFHPIILLPLIGQILLVFAAIRNPRKYTLTFVGMSLLGMIVLMICLAGILSANLKIISSTIPYMSLCVLVLLKRKSEKAHNDRANEVPET